MTDKELLELAAKAIGFEFRLNMVEAGQLFKDGEYVCFWKPLEDDGDALRLAVKLQFDVEIGDDDVWANSTIAQNNQLFEWHKGDAMAATRRAIVRAAAEIGKATPAA